jgi:hypothetical protein
MTRLWAEPVEIKVETDGGGQPSAFRWAEGMYQVSQIANRWRVHTHWWRKAIWREYFKVVIDADFGETSARPRQAQPSRSAEPLSRTELLCTLYHDLLGDHWYLERVYD